MKSKGVYIILVVFLCACQVKDSTEKITETFFKKYKKEESDAALDFLFSTNKWAIQSKVQLQQIKDNLNKSTKDLGTYYGLKWSPFSTSLKT